MKSEMQIKKNLSATLAVKKLARIIYLNKQAFYHGFFVRWLYRKILIG